MKKERPTYRQPHNIGEYAGMSPPLEAKLVEKTHGREKYSANGNGHQEVQSRNRAKMRRI